MYFSVALSACTHLSHLYFFFIIVVVIVDDADVVNVIRFNAMPYSFVFITFFFYFCINLFNFIFFSSSFWFVRLLSVISHLASRWRSDDGVEFFSCRASVCVCECVCSMALRPSARSHFPSSIKPRRKKIVYGRAVVCALCAHPSARSRVKELFTYTYTHSHRKKTTKQA